MDFDDFDKKDDTYYVLWVRHCLSCANVHAVSPIELKKGTYKPRLTNKKISAKKKLHREPLCTKLGMVQALVFGQNLENIINNLPTHIKYAFNGVDLYSSVLPRAVETAKIISIGIPNLVNTPIYRMLYVQEENNWYERTFTKHKQGTSNITTLVKSNCHVKLLNDILEGSHISDEIIGCNDIKCDIFKANPEKDHESWKKYILRRLDSSKLNLIVSHHHVMREHILKFPETKGVEVKNLGAALVEYKYDYATGKVFEKLITTIDVDSSKSQIKIPDSKYFTCNYSYEKDIQKKYCPE